ncbi:MAG: DNA repair and recombination protein RadA [Nanoarchaeota archaeon]|nr:DNA repair and recombination protein RadA [Nanoarchaeota archaeon]
MKKEEMKIEDLPGVGAATAEKLRDAGYNDLMSIAVASPGELTESVGMGEAAARKIINAGRNNLDMGFASGEELLEKRAKIIKINTGSKAFDELVGGGFESGCITECFGSYGSGKCCDKDTRVLYFNSSKPHLETMEEVYEKYKNIYGEQKGIEGDTVEVPPVVVMGFKDNKLDKVQSKFIYREKVKKLYEIETERGRKLRITGPHKLLSFNKGLEWTPAAILQKGKIIAYPKKIECEGDCQYNIDEAYFLGLFVAEGCRNPVRISTGSEKLKDWTCNFLNNKFKFQPTASKDKRNDCYQINLRNASHDLLGNLKDCDASTKFVPEELLHANEEIVSSFLAGYIDGDGHFGENFEVTTKSKRLAEDLTYLFLRLGISVTKKNKVLDNEQFWRLSVASEDSVKLNKIPCKIKDCEYTFRNTKYGYSKDIIQYLREIYKETLGGNRGRREKRIGKKSIGHERFYKYLTGEGEDHRNINAKTMQTLFETFLESRKDIQKALKINQNIEKLSKEEFNELYGLLPFAFNSIHKELGLSKNTLANYIQRGLPHKNKKTISKIKETLKASLEQRKKTLDKALATIKNIVYFNWDTIKSVKEIDYNDYVYDFVVPEGHCFVGGDMPTMLHNTALANQLAINALDINEEGEPQAYAVWIDSENTFRPERIKQICDENGLDPMKILRNIKVVRAFNSDHQMMCAEKVEDLIQKEGLKINMIIVDSLMTHFRSEFIGRGTLAMRQQKINKHMHVLMKIADQYNLAVYVTNQVMSKPDTFFGDPTEAIGGNIVGHNSATRLYLRRGKKGTRVAKLVDSPYLPDGECIFRITDKGIEDN